VGLEQARVMVGFALLQGSVYRERQYGLPGHHEDANFKGEGKSNSVNTDDRNLLPFHLHLQVGPAPHLCPTPHLRCLNRDEQLPFLSLHLSEIISALAYSGAGLIARRRQGVHSRRLNEGVSLFALDKESEMYARIYVPLHQSPRENDAHAFCHAPSWAPTLQPK